jgi:protein-S-isoprenylcysteine O-methyltransferase Ste14
MIISLLLGYDASRQNKYISIGETAVGMKIVDTGIYKFIRHPYYLSSILKIIGASLLLGSYISLLILIPHIISMAFFICLEEAELENDIENYKVYKTKTRYRLMPMIW